jgi:hypothetical protein
MRSVIASTADRTGGGRVPASRTVRRVVRFVLRRSRVARRQPVVRNELTALANVLEISLWYQGFQGDYSQ